MTKKPKPEERAIGRPTVFTPDVVSKLEEAFKFDATVIEACAYAGVSRAAYYAEENRNEDFKDRMERAQQFPFMLAKKTVIQAMADNDGNLAMKFLKNRQRDRYHEKVEEVVTEPPKDHAKELADDMLKRAAAKAPSTDDAQPA